MTYREKLDVVSKYCEEKKIALIEVIVAKEVDCQIESNEQMEQFEEVCAVVNEFYLCRCDTITSLENVVQAVLECINDGLDIKQIHDEDIEERLQ